jgi:hypothetical protein
VQVELTNEFASVQLEVDRAANGPRLLVRDLVTGHFIYLDPKELSALTRVRHEDLQPFVDPAFEDRL